MKTWFLKYYPLLLILSVGTALRLNLLFIRGTFWFDEAFSAHFSRLPWPEAIRYWIMETNPPFYTFFLRHWIGLTSADNEILIRLPSLIFSLMAIAAIYLFAEKIFSRRTAIVSSLLFALSGIYIFISTEARVYSLLPVLALLSCFFYYSIFFEKKEKTTLWIGYFIANLLLCYSHLTALMAPLCQGLFLIFLKPEKKILKKWLGCHLIIGLLWLAWFAPSILSKISQDSLTAWYFDSSITDYANILTLFFSSLINANVTPLIFTLVSFIYVICLITAMIKAKNENDSKQKGLLIFLLLFGLLPIIAGTMLGVIVTKFYVAFFPALFIIIGFVLSSLAKTKNTFAILTIIISLLLFPPALTIASTKIFSWHRFTDYIEKNETERSLTIVIPFNEILAMKKYYQGRRPLLGVYLKEDNFAEDERIVKYNWNRQITEKEKLKEWLEKKIKGADKIFYIQYTQDYGWTHQLLIENGWKVSKIIKNEGYIGINLFEFHAPVKTPGK